MIEKIEQNKVRFICSCILCKIASEAPQTENPYLDGHKSLASMLVGHLTVFRNAIAELSETDDSADLGYAEHEQKALNAIEKAVHWELQYGGNVEHPVNEAYPHTIMHKHAVGKTITPDAKKAIATLVQGAYNRGLDHALELLTTNIVADEVEKHGSVYLDTVGGTYDLPYMFDWADFYMHMVSNVRSDIEKLKVTPQPDEPPTIDSAPNNTRVLVKCDGKWIVGIRKNHERDSKFMHYWHYEGLHRANVLPTHWLPLPA